MRRMRRKSTRQPSERKRTAWAAWLALPLLTICAFGQSNIGELRINVSDPQGLGVRSDVELVSEVNQFQKTFTTDGAGGLTAKLLPFGLYRIAVKHEGFVAFSESVEVRSAVPASLHVTLSIVALNTSITVDADGTLVDPYRTGSVNRVGTNEIETRQASLPGRSLQDLVNSQPGWLYEGNAVLHPRGSEYQTQFVINGVPLTDDRSPGFGPEIEADDVQSVAVYTAGIPAEYGRKMGGVIEINTTRDTRPGLHGQLALTGASYATGGAFGALQYGWGKNTLSASTSGSRTDHYLNPPVVQNYTNAGTTGDFSLAYERELTPADRLGFSVRHELSRFQVPNEQIQQAAGQRQDRNNFENMGVASYQHILSPNVVMDLRGMLRDDAEALSSNLLSTPVIAFANSGFREGYFKGSIAVHHGRHEVKAGVESDATFLREKFRYQIADFLQFDPDTPAAFAFTGRRPDLEQSAYIQDMIRMGRWTVSAGLRYDHYQLSLNQSAFSPRLGVGYSIPSADLVIHASYDRVFQTPKFNNILLSSSPHVASLSDQVLRLPVQPSHGDYYEAGLTKGFLKKLRLDANAYYRTVNNFADDDRLLDTGESFPIAFGRAKIYGAESKLELPRWGRVSGFASYSYMVGSVYLPVTGGLFLGDDASRALNQIGGRFWVTQDQRNTVRTRFRFQVAPRVWVALGSEYGSGLPVEFSGTKQDSLNQFGQAIVDRVDFDRGRIRPSLSVDASVGAEIWKNDTTRVRLQCDVQNLNNRLNLIDFAGVFSGNAIAPARSYSIRLATSF